ncbi:LysR family transcriptional regulator [Mycobacterium branderi]|uniref:LysR family transcriptional regulator n=1 Tax=Mycobacterium branderi TaxID=43348 RepID=UPI00361AE662
MRGKIMIQQLEYLLALARERHFGRAAAACHVSQPTLSAAVSTLERELDTRIVLRGRRFEGFTAEGERVVTWARRILAERDELLADIARARGGLTATARIAAIPTAVPATPFVTRQFLDRHPHARVRIEAMSSREIAQRLADYEIDAGLTYLDDETPPGTRHIRLYQERYALLAPATHPLMELPAVAWADAAKLPLCALTIEMRNRRIIETNMAADGARFIPVVETNTIGALYAHLTSLQLASIVAHTWLHAFGVPTGLAVRPMIQRGPGPWVGLIVLNRQPNSILAEALLTAADDPDVLAAIRNPVGSHIVDTESAQ